MWYVFVKIFPDRKPQNKNLQLFLNFLLKFMLYQFLVVFLFLLNLFLILISNFHNVAVLNAPWIFAILNLLVFRLSICFVYRCRLTEEKPLEFSDHLYSLKSFKNHVNLPRAAVRYVVSKFYYVCPHNSPIHIKHKTHKKAEKFILLLIKRVLIKGRRVNWREYV